MSEPLILFCLAYMGVAYYTAGVVRPLVEAVDELDAVDIWIGAACLAVAWGALGYFYARTARLCGVALIVFATGCGADYAGVSRAESPTLDAGATWAEECYQAVEGSSRRLPADLEAVTVHPDTVCPERAVACAVADERRIYLVEPFYQGDAVAVVAHELVHLLLEDDWPGDGEAHHVWLEAAVEAHPECSGIPARRLQEVAR